ncbi:MAG: AglZ/HisF2 family acetamidino modification protein [Chitinophagales bacterium]
MNTSKRFLPRVIPILLLKSRDSLVKTKRFRDPVYVGDPLNAVKIFNEKEVDELVLLDITASKKSREPDYEYIEQIAAECFMPVTYGGGVKTLDQFQKIIACGIEKVAINSATVDCPELVSEAAAHFGSSSVVVSLDVMNDFFKGRKIFSHMKQKLTDNDPTEEAKKMESLGAGEILLQSVNRDGTMEGYDLELIKSISHNISIPLIACGGAGKLSDFTQALEAGASAVGAGSKFVFYGKHRAVLINYLSHKELEQLSAAER